MYTVTYHLPLVLSRDREAYPEADHASPLGDQFQFFVTGLREDMVRGNTPTYTLSYPTLCFETNEEVLPPGYAGIGLDSLAPYKGASVIFNVDDIPQLPARISETGTLQAVTPQDKAPMSSFDLWNYCLTQNWSTGSHLVRMTVTPRQGVARIFHWEFVVESSDHP